MIDDEASAMRAVLHWWKSLEGLGDSRRILEVVDVGDSWRVFTSSSWGVITPDGQLERRGSKLDPVPTSVDKVTGRVGKEWPLLRDPLGGTAQEAFKTMVNAQVAPALRGLGLHGSGTAWRVSEPGYQGTIGLKRTRSSNSAIVQVQVSIAAGSAAQWDRAQGTTPLNPPTTVWWEHLNRPPQPDDKMTDQTRWWVLAGVDTASEAQLFIHTVQNHGLPRIYEKFDELRGRGL